MRTLVVPPPTTRCEHCGGELRLKQVIPASIDLELDRQVFVCAACSREQAYTVPHDRNTPPLKVRPQPSSSPRLDHQAAATALTEEN